MQKCLMQIMHNYATYAGEFASRSRNRSPLEQKGTQEVEGSSQTRTQEPAIKTRETTEARINLLKIFCPLEWAFAATQVVVATGRSGLADG